MDDLIRRKGIVDTVCEGISCNECSFNEIDGESGCLLAYRIDNLPSAQKTGKWIQAEDIPTEYAVCTNCKGHGEFYMDYCCHCGCRMVGEDDG